ncbi:MAG: MGMT family protein [Patescibacteria group bacterium]|nr:MGMT family protein [Patescibacteria group bacterium]
MRLFSEKVHLIIRNIPRGRVATYREVARAIGRPRAARAVGNALNRNPYSSKRVPCHRVVRSDGLVGGYAKGVKAKIKMLEEEGIEIRRGGVNLNKFGFKF